jgi:C4-dicarboxylate-specific signal transduction histidine kinase
VRIVSHLTVAVVAFLVGLGVGYLLWGLHADSLANDLRAARADCEQRVGDAQRRAREAEDRVQQEIAARRAIEDALNRVSPQK